MSDSQVPVDEDGLIRLQKLLAMSNVASRRKCEELMLAGEVEVDGEVVTRLGTKVDPTRAVIRVQGRRLPPVSPHVYLDTVLLLGSLANGSEDRWAFAGGAVVASLLWFTGLGYGARLASPLFARPRAWQVLDVLIGVTMLLIAVGLARG